MGNYGSLASRVEEVKCGDEIRAEREFHPHRYYLPRQFPETRFMDAGQTSQS